MEKSYEEITVYELQDIFSTDITADIILDGDRKTVYINSLNIAFKNLGNAIVQAFESILSRIVKAWQSLFDALKPLMYSKLSKKKFMKLLQSEGIQRNEINKIVANNKEPYTYVRLLQVINEHRKEK